MEADDVNSHKSNKNDGELEAFKTLNMNKLPTKKHYY